MFVNEKAENKSESSQVIKPSMKEMTNRYKKYNKYSIFRLFYNSEFGGYRIAEQSDMRRIIRENYKRRKK